MVYVSVPGFLSNSNQCSTPLGKAEVVALGHLITFQAGDFCRLLCQERGRLVSFSWADDVEIAIFAKLEMELKGLPGSEWNCARNPRRLSSKRVWQHFEPVVGNLLSGGGRFRARWTISAVHRFLAFFSRKLPGSSGFAFSQLTAKNPPTPTTARIKTKTPAPTNISDLPRDFCGLAKPPQPWAPCGTVTLDDMSSARAGNGVRSPAGVGFIGNPALGGAVGTASTVIIVGAFTSDRVSEASGILKV